MARESHQGRWGPFPAWGMARLSLRHWGPRAKLGTVHVSRLRLLQAVANVKRQLCSVYRQLFLASAGPSLSQGLRDRAQKLMR